MFPHSARLSSWANTRNLIKFRRFERHRQPWLEEMNKTFPMWKLSWRWYLAASRISPWSTYQASSESRRTRKRKILRKKSRVWSQSKLSWTFAPRPPPSCSKGDLIVLGRSKVSGRASKASKTAERITNAAERISEVAGRTSEAAVRPLKDKEWKKSQTYIAFIAFIFFITSLHQVHLPKKHNNSGCLPS